VVQVGRALAGAVGLLAVLLALCSVVVPLDPGSLLVGLGCGCLVTAAVARTAPGPLGPADLVTLTRAVLACVVATLVTDGWLGEPVTALLLGVASVALVLDAVDGRVARATRTQTAFGGRFDGEADAFLLLVLSVHVAQSHGAWVLAIGVARYAFGAAGLVFPWLRAPLPRRDWRKLVTAVQGITLVVAASGLLPAAPTHAALLVALALLAESFGRDVVWLARRRPRGVQEPGPVGARRLPVP
jgi:phosphatidylglycerophosphate synthase